MVHILFISRYYFPEKAAAAVCVREMAERLVASGYKVTVLTTKPSYPNGVVPEDHKGYIVREEMLEGVKIIRTWSYVSANKGFLRRILSQLSFGFLSSLLGRRAVGQTDVIIVGSPPLFNVIAGRVLSWWKHCPFVFWVADLWPESAVQLGALHNPLFIKLSEWLEWSTYRSANFVWAVTEGMRKTLIRRGLPSEHIFFLPNGVDTNKFRPQPQAPARASLGWDDKFTVVYAGTHGLSHGLTTILDAAEKLQGRDEVRFVLVGDGAEKEELVADARRRELKNVTFLNPIPHEQMPNLLAAADVCLAHTRKVQLFEGMLPIKMYEAMACGRPLVLALNGEARDMAERENAALCVEPENADAIAEGIIYLLEHPDEAKLLAQHGREYVMKHFDYDLLSKKLEMRLMPILKNKIKRTVEAENLQLAGSSQSDSLKF